MAFPWRSKTKKYDFLPRSLLPLLEMMRMTKMMMPQHWSAGARD
jgi:hypothetical protein